MQENKKEVSINLEGIYKKFSTSLHGSMWYGTVDLAKRLAGIKVDTTRLRKHERWVLKNINLKVKKNEILSVIGLNGSGKSTLIRIIAGIYPPDRGKPKVIGNVMSLFANTTAMNTLFTGRENIYIRGTALGISKARLKAYEDQIIDFANLGNALDKPFGSYSSGMRARLGFATAIYSDFDILLIDENLAVGDMRFKVKALRKLVELAPEKIILIVTQKPRKITSICTRHIAIDKGKIIYETKGNDDIVRWYDEFCFGGRPEFSNLSDSEKEFE